MAYKKASSKQIFRDSSTVRFSTKAIVCCTVATTTIRITQKIYYKLIFPITILKNTQSVFLYPLYYYNHYVIIGLPEVALIVAGEYEKGKKIVN